MSERRRGQKEGSLYQRSRDGYWVAAISLGNGKRRVVYDRTFDGALEKRDALRASLKLGTASASRITVGVLFADWLEAKKGTIRPKTADRYASLVRRHVSQIAEIRLSKLTVRDLAAFYRARSARVAPKTIRHLHFVVKAALAWAVRRELIGRNPADQITAEDLPRAVRREMKVLTVEQSHALLGAAAGTRHEPLIAFSLVTGCRIGETMGLTWGNLDLETGRVKISHTLQYLAGRPTLVEPKTRAAVRELVLPTFALPVMKFQRLWQEEQARRLGRAWLNGLDLVFVRETGAPLNRHHVIRRCLRPLLAKAGLPASTRVHDLRHGAASLMLAQGVPVPAVAEMLGHATPAITMAIYSHAMPDSQALVAAKMQSSFGNQRISVADSVADGGV